MRGATLEAMIWVVIGKISDIGHLQTSHFPFFLLFDPSGTLRGN